MPEALVMDPVSIGAITVVLSAGMLALWHMVTRDTLSLSAALEPHTYITPTDAAEDIDSGMLPAETPHLHVLQKRGVSTTEDLKAYGALTEIPYVGPQRAEAISSYLAAELPTDESWPKEIQVRM